MKEKKMDILEKKGIAYEKRHQLFMRWKESVPKWHDNFVFSPITKTEFTKPTKLLKNSRIALVTSAGIHLKSQPPFDLKNEFGDWSYRIIPTDTPPGDLMISDTHYDHSDPDEDINCIFPISHLNEFAKEGFIGSVAKNHYGFMGFVPNPEKLISDTAPEVAAFLKDDNVDIVFLTPG
jgi:D-proline reductase (dithiol) PrdB